MLRTGFTVEIISVKLVIFISRGRKTLPARFIAVSLPSRSPDGANLMQLSRLLNFNRNYFALMDKKNACRVDFEFGKLNS